MSTLIAFIRADLTLDDTPVLPASWQRTIESDRWTSIYPLGKADGRYFHARLIARAAGNPGRALFVCTGPAPMLTRLAAAIANDALPWTRTWATLAELRAALSYSTGNFPSSFLTTGFVLFLLQTVLQQNLDPQEKNGV